MYNLVSWKYDSLEQGVQISFTLFHYVVHINTLLIGEKLHMKMKQNMAGQLP